MNVIFIFICVLLQQSLFLLTCQAAIQKLNVENMCYEMQL